MVSREIEYQRLRDYDYPQPQISKDDEKLLLAAADRAISYLSSFIRPGKVWSHAEARDFLLSSDAASGAPGYPFTQATKAEALTQEVYEQWMTWDLSPDEEPVFAVALKREFIKESKIKQKKTRLFMSAPMFHHLSCLRRFGDFAEKFLQLVPCVTPGKPFQYGGWDAMMRSLQGRKIFCTDFSAYDISQHDLFFRVFKRVLKSLCECPEEEVDWLVDIAQHALCVTTDGVLFRKHVGNPSGWFLTLVMNTVNLIILWFAWAMDNGYTYNQTVEGFSALFCGDDSAIATNLSVADPAQTWTRFGLTVKELAVVQDVSEVEYCGATSVRLCGFLVRRPRVSKFLDQLAWTSDCSPAYVFERARAIYMELFPVREYAEYVRRFLVWMQENHPELRRRPIPSDAELIRLYTGLEGRVRNDSTVQNEPC